MSDINLLTDLLIKFTWLGNWLFFTLALVESAPFMGVFVPGSTLISIGGFLASQDLLNVWDIIIFGTLGAILGDFLSYSLGRWGGKWINDKKIINQKLLKHGEKFFYKYGNTSIFWGRFFGPLRAIIPFIAGVSKMKQRPFIFWNIVSAICWSFLNVFAGYFSGTLIISILKKWSSGMSIILILVITIATFYWIVKKKGQSLKTSFQTKSLDFIEYLSNKKWFQKIVMRYHFVGDFFNESKKPAEKIFGSFIIFSFLISIYLLMLILDVF